LELNEDGKVKFYDSMWTEIYVNHQKCYGLEELPLLLNQLATRYFNAIVKNYSLPPVSYVNSKEITISLLNILLLYY